MDNVFIVLYCVCCLAMTAMCLTGVVYMIRDMNADSGADETDDDPVDNEPDEDVTDDA